MPTAGPFTAATTGFGSRRMPATAAGDRGGVNVDLLLDVGHPVVGVRLEAGLEVGARREAAPRAGDQHRAHRRVGGRAEDRVAQRRADLGRPRVEGLGPVEWDAAYGPLLLPEDCAHEGPFAVRD